LAKRLRQTFSILGKNTSRMSRRCERLHGVAGAIDGSIYVAGGFRGLAQDVTECRVTWA